MMTEKVKFWVQIAVVFAVVFVALPAWLGGSSWVVSLSGAVVCVIRLRMHVLRYGQTTKHLWRIRPAGRWAFSPRPKRRLGS